MRLAVVIRVALLAFLPCSALAYGPRGHQMIGAIADSQLTHAAKAAVALNLGYSLRTAATWADCVKDVEKQHGVFVYNADPQYAASCKAFLTTIGKDRMIGYARRNWDKCHDEEATKGCHALYHFADVTIKEDHYDTLFTGTSNHDIVSAMQAAIFKLQGKEVPAPFSIKDKAEAMLMLAHLVGDLHQPLHVGSIYLNDQNVSADPGPVSVPYDRKMYTRGGNFLEVGSSNLHADWDGVSSSWDPLHLTKEVRDLAKSVPDTSGGAEDWPKAWANESIKEAKGAFSGLTYTRTGAKKVTDWVTTFPDRAAYLQNKRDVQKQEMVTAGARLAQILNSVWP